jgi:ergothioneine biosynthesis protein EgtB
MRMSDSVCDRLAGVWRRTDQIFATLAPEALLSRPIALRHPFIFYVGHLPAFAWNHLCAGTLGAKSFNPKFDDMFSRGIDPDVEDPARCHDHPDPPERWPSLGAVLAYRDRVREAVAHSIDAVMARAPEDPMAVGGRVFSMVIEHELMHQETLLYMVQQLGEGLKAKPAWLPAHVLSGARRCREIEIAAGTATLGAAFDALAFGWDNEFPETPIEVPAFAIDSVPVTNGEFLEFVERGGYARPDLWRPEDWTWKSRSGLEHPTFWVRPRGIWCYQTLFELLPLVEVAEWPVSVSLAEARAYARWRGRRLPTEAEFHRAAYGEPVARTRELPGAPAPTSCGNFDFRHWAPTPVGRDAGSASAWGVHDLIGNGWEWTDTAFDGLPGFKAYIERYPGYSADFFDGKHFVLKGASWATAAELVRPSFRNWFQAHYPYVFAKFRCVADR